MFQVLILIEFLINKDNMLITLWIYISILRIIIKIRLNKNNFDFIKTLLYLFCHNIIRQSTEQRIRRSNPGLELNQRYTKRNNSKLINKNNFLNFQ